MEGLSFLGKTLVIAPHPDDEILGCGGTMARLADEGAEVVVAIVTTGREPAFPAELVARLRGEIAAAHEVIGTREVRFLDLPAAALDTVAGSAINAAFDRLIDEVRPDTVFVPFVGDIHMDHQLSFMGAMVAARPRSLRAPRRIYAYETLSETNWYAPPITPAFTPNVFIDIAPTLERKLAAFGCFASQVRAFPDERSPEAIRALAMLRGATVYRHAAEGFMLVRQID